LHAPGTYVFRTRYGTPWRYPDFHSDRWTPARVDAEARGLSKHATPHILRHTAVVWSLARGTDRRRVRNAGPRVQVTYDIYGGSINLHDPQMAQAMAKEVGEPARSEQPGPGGCTERRRGSRPSSMRVQKNVLNRRPWRTREDLRIAIVTWIERTYHRRRRQDALSRLTPSNTRRS